ncbi:MAG: hypothetical protein FJZ04_00190 [Candidatus Moranbacteria bacterium]|nr:hypothetical protein [Candidatus Moranbacteria bacterium]
MKIAFVPKTKLGKWSVGLSSFFVTVVFFSIILVKILGILSFGDRWWDVTVPIAFLASIIAFILGIMDIRKNEETAVLVYLAVIIGFLTILFIPLHSLFIND